MSEGWPSLGREHPTAAVLPWSVSAVGSGLENACPASGHGFGSLFRWKVGSTLLRSETAQALK